MAGKTIVFFPEGADRPTSSCVGIGEILQARGHRVVFIVEESFAGTLEARGFEEGVMRLGPPPATEEVPGQLWIDFIRATSPIFRLPTIEQLGQFIAPTYTALADGARYVHDRLLEIIDEVRPDVVVEDDVVAFPALSASGVPWAPIASCNPLEIRDPAIAPVFSGYPEADRSAWPQFLAEYEATHRELWEGFDAFCRERGAPGLPALELMDESPYLNLYFYPDEVDYRRERPLPATWHSVQTSVRAPDGPWELPAELRDGPGRLIYLSLGSLGSADVGLMQRLVDVLATVEHRVIVSKGPLADEIALHDRMWGEGFLPQPAILPLVDLVITHGGNNTTTEAWYHGKPMIALPLFWDQYDNAQRIDETGLGVRLATYAFEDHELTGAVERLLGDAALGRRLDALSARLKASPGTPVAAGLIERLAVTGAPVTR